MKEPKIVINNYIDESINNRIIMIKPDGNMEVIADASGYAADEFRHMLFFKNYFKNHYLNDKNLQVYGNNMDAYGAVTYILSKIYRNILIIDTSTGRDANTYGVIQLPDNITNDQKNTFDNLKNYVNKYLEFAIFAGPIIKDGIPGNKVYKTLKRDEFDRILDYTEVLDNTNKR